MATYRTLEKQLNRWVSPRISAIQPIRLAVGAAICAGAAAFIKLLSEVTEGDTRALDEALLRSLRTANDLAQPIGPVWLTSVMRDVTALGSLTILAIITLLVLAFLLSQKRGRTAAVLAVSVITGTLVSSVLKVFIARPRPELVPHLVEVTSLSFPSGHAMISAVVYLTLGALLARQFKGRRTQVFVLSAAAVLTLLVGVSRIYLGVHYPTDVLGGWCAGATWAALCLVAAELTAKNDRKANV